MTLEQKAEIAFREAEKQAAEEYPGNKVVRVRKFAKFRDFDVFGKVLEKEIRDEEIVLSSVVGIGVNDSGKVRLIFPQDLGEMTEESDET